MVLALLAAHAVTAEAPHYGVIAKYPIPEDGGWDYLAVDSPGHRLFISRGSMMQVMDTKDGKIVGTIPDTPGVHGAALAPKAGKGYTSNGRDNTVSIFDLKTLKVLKKVTVGTGPDAIWYDPFSNRVFTFNARSQDATAVDVATDTVVGTVPLGGKPEFPQADGAGHIYVNMEDLSTVKSIDTKSLKVDAEWPIAPGEEASGLAIDTKDHVVFSTCSNETMAVSDYRAHKVVASPKIGKGPDAGAFDPGLGLAFSSNGQDGTLTVIGKVGGKWDVVDTVQTQKSARTMALDAKTHRIYLICAEFKASTNPNQRRGTMVPGSTAILVVGPKP